MGKWDSQSLYRLPQGTRPDGVLKSRKMSLATKVCIVTAMVFQAVMYGCESWAIKKTEHQRIDAFRWWCWRRRWRIPWTSRRWSSQSERKPTLNIDWKDWWWSWSSNTCGHLMQKASSAEKTLMPGETEGRRRRRQEDEMVGWHHRLSGHEFEQAPRDSEGQRGAWYAASHGVTESRTRFRERTTNNPCSRGHVWREGAEHPARELGEHILLTVCPQRPGRGHSRYAAILKPLQDDNVSR